MFFSTTQYFVESIYVSVLLIIAIYVFLVFTFFLLLNTFDLKYIKNLSDLKKFGIVFPLNLVFLMTILSFAGIPPLFGFSIKLMLFLIVIKGTAIFYTVLLTLFNFFTLYFYIQNVRYVINNTTNVFYLYVNHFMYLSDTTMFVLLGGLLLNTVGVLYLPELIVFFTNYVL